MLPILTPARRPAISRAGLLSDRTPAGYCTAAQKYEGSGSQNKTKYKKTI